MKRVDYQDWKREIAKKRRRLFVLEATYTGRAAGRRPRDPEKERVLTQLDIARWKRYIESGKVQIIGPRLWKWRIDAK
jgi:hypothetical protein